MIEFTYLLEIVQRGHLEDRLSYSVEDFSLVYKDANAELLYKAVAVIAKHPDANVARVLRVLSAWNSEDLLFLIDLFD